jgi:hypothetical protein
VEARRVDIYVDRSLTSPLVRHMLPVPPQQITYVHVHWTAAAVFGGTRDPSFTVAVPGLARRTSFNAYTFLHV